MLKFISSWTFLRKNKYKNSSGNFEHVSGPPSRNHSSLMIRSTLVRLKERSVKLKSLITRNCSIIRGTLEIEAQRSGPMCGLRVTHRTQPPSSVSFAAKCVSIVVGLPEGGSPPKTSLSQSYANLSSKPAMISELLSAVATFPEIKWIQFGLLMCILRRTSLFSHVGLDWELWKA